MTILQEKILHELTTASDNLKKCKKDPEDVDLLIFSLLKCINSGQVRGIFKVRINGHTITNPSIDELKISLEEVATKITDFNQIIKI